MTMIMSNIVSTVGVLILKNNEKVLLVRHGKAASHLIIDGLELTS